MTLHQGAVFSYLSAEQRVPGDHPLRAIRAMVDEAQAGMSALYSVPSERRLMKQLDYKPGLPLVRGPQHGRRDLGRDRVHQEP